MCETIRRGKLSLAHLQGIQARLPDRGTLQREDRRDVFTHSALWQCSGLLMISDVGGCSVFSLDQVFVDQIFRIFDKDGNGSIDFKVLFA